MSGTIQTAIRGTHLSEKPRTIALSVIVPCFNEASTIEHCLDSILSNGFDPGKIEVLVVDGCSDDGTTEIVRVYGKRHPAVRLLVNPKRSIPCALNIGIASAVGDAVMRLDAHSSIQPGYIAGCLEELGDRQDLMVGGRVEIKARTDSKMGRAIAEALSTRFGVGGAGYRRAPTARLEPMPVDTLPYWCASRRLLQSVMPYNEHLERSEDIEFSLRLARQGVIRLLMPQVGCTYYARSTLGELWQHSRLNGAWAILPFAYVQNIPVRPRHLVPFAFVGALCIAALLWVASPVGYIPLLGLIALYSAASILVALTTAIRRRNSMLILLMPLAFAALHFGYGIGSWIGLARLIARLRLPGRRDV